MPLDTQSLSGAISVVLGASSSSLGRVTHLNRTAKGERGQHGRAGTRREDASSGEQRRGRARGEGEEGPRGRGGGGAGAASHAHCLQCGACERHRVLLVSSASAEPCDGQGSDLYELNREAKKTTSRPETKTSARSIGSIFELKGKPYQDSTQANGNAPHRLIRPPSSIRATDQVASRSYCQWTALTLSHGIGSSAAARRIHDFAADPSARSRRVRGGCMHSAAARLASAGAAKGALQSRTATQGGHLAFRNHREPLLRPTRTCPAD